MSKVIILLNNEDTHFDDQWNEENNLSQNFSPHYFTFHLISVILFTIYLLFFSLQ